MIYPEPSYLSGMVTAADKAQLSKAQKEYGSRVTAFRFNNPFSSLDFAWNDAYEGKVWGVEASGNKILLFDHDLHGYDGVHGHYDIQPATSVQSMDFSEPTHIVIAFQYSGDEKEYVADGGPSEFEQDYFGWVAIYQQNRDGLEEVVNFECS